MARSNILRKLADRRLVSGDLAEQAERLDRGDDAPLGEPLDLDDLLALAEIDQEDIARAAETWRGKRQPARPARRPPRQGDAPRLRL